MSAVIDDLPELRNFVRLYAGVDTAPILEEIALNNHRWTEDTSRQKINVQRETQTIGLHIRIPEPGLSIHDMHGTAWGPQAVHFPRTREFLEAFAGKHHGELARAMLVRLKPGGKVYRHIDGGEYFKRRDRYHLVLDSATGSAFSCGDEIVRMRNGELWWFDNKKPHHAINDGISWRVHLIFDLTPQPGKGQGDAAG